MNPPCLQALCKQAQTYTYLLGSLEPLSSQQLFHRPGPSEAKDYLWNFCAPGSLDCMTEIVSVNGANPRGQNCCNCQTEIVSVNGANPRCQKRCNCQKHFHHPQPLTSLLCVPFLSACPLVMAMELQVTGRVALHESGVARIDLAPLLVSPPPAQAPRPTCAEVQGWSLHPTRLPMTERVLQSAMVTVQKQLSLRTGLISR